MNIRESSFRCKLMTNKSHWTVNWKKNAHHMENVTWIFAIYIGEKSWDPHYICAWIRLVFGYKNIHFVTSKYIVALLQYLQSFSAYSPLFQNSTFSTCTKCFTDTEFSRTHSVTSEYESHVEWFGGSQSITLSIHAKMAVF